MSQWVQHISGQGPTHGVFSETGVSWRTRTPPGSHILLYDLPKSDYRLCDPPERWIDVTEQCELLEGVDGATHRIIMDQWSVGYVVKGYRLRKIPLDNSLSMPGWAFVVERKEG